MSPFWVAQLAGENVYGPILHTHPQNVTRLGGPSNAIKRVWAKIYLHRWKIGCTFFTSPLQKVTCTQYNIICQAGKNAYFYIKNSGLSEIVFKATGSNSISFQNPNVIPIQIQIIKNSSIYLYFLIFLRKISNFTFSFYLISSFWTSKKKRNEEKDCCTYF